MAGCICSLPERVLYCRITGLGTIKSKIKKVTHDIAVFRTELFLLVRSRSGVRAGIGVDIFRWSRSRSWSRLKSLTPQPCSVLYPIALQWSKPTERALIQKHKVVKDRDGKYK